MSKRGNNLSLGDVPDALGSGRVLSSPFHADINTPMSPEHSVSPKEYGAHLIGLIYLHSVP